MHRILILRGLLVSTVANRLARGTTSSPILRLFIRQKISFDSLSPCFSWERMSLGACLNLMPELKEAGADEIEVVPV
jgi:hypothetical protein